MNPLSAAYAAAFGATEPASVSRRPPALRVLTCGAVDDGKSTLLGRLLYEAGAVPDDQFADLRLDSHDYGSVQGEVDFALLTDGLEAERERGITIDVAYRYVSTMRRDFVFADTPGHEQYTANMATGASQSEVAIIVADAVRGLRDQSYRHAAICSTLGIRHAVLAVNKMDCVEFSRQRFEQIAEAFAPATARLNLDCTAIPISARYGDNVVKRSANMLWHRAPTLLGHLERILPRPSANSLGLRLPIQGVWRDAAGGRFYMGSIAAGRLSRGDMIVAAPSGAEAAIASLSGAAGPTEGADAGTPVAFTLTPEIDLGRGDLLYARGEELRSADHFEANVIWFGRGAMCSGRDYELRLGIRTSPVTVTAIRGRLDVKTGECLEATEIRRDDIAICDLATPAAVAFDPYAVCSATGSFLLIDRITGDTVAAGMVVRALDRGSDVSLQKLTIGRAAREKLLGQTGAVVWFTGLSGAGKSTIADAVERKLHSRRTLTFLLDGDNVRLGLNRDLGFTDADRAENLRRVAEVARLMVDAGLVVLCSFISPFARERAMIRERLADVRFLEVFVDAPLALCERRDPKGLYAKARRGELRNFTGIDSPYERPVSPDLVLDSSALEADALADRVLERLIEPSKAM
ncbi:adenylyl-sulfate kinase [Plastoroseomonas hellenica]|uniref:adenylyl-sulfate kinase n=1 Tax=Plastoroseomonas hellenica TaxID=2687306 RepID=UPI001BA9EA25|nr:adenylyl-sulfate kinase [Plastoroseomonas hellenica]MBR0647491.1 adenylyl-sulfate kinase [Plastoroseomonas hellenica]